MAGIKVAQAEARVSAQGLCVVLLNADVSVHTTRSRTGKRSSKTAKLHPLAELYPK